MYISLLIIETLKFVVTYYTIWFNLELSNRRNFPTIWFNQVKTHSFQIVKNVLKCGPNQNLYSSNSRNFPTICFNPHLSLVMRKPVFAICEQQRHRSAYASAQWICYVVAIKFQQKAHYCHGRHQILRASNQVLWNMWPYDFYDIISWHWKTKTFNEDMFYIFNNLCSKTNTEYK